MIFFIFLKNMWLTYWIICNYTISCQYVSSSTDTTITFHSRDHMRLISRTNKVPYVGWSYLTNQIFGSEFPLFLDHQTIMDAYEIGPNNDGYTYRSKKCVIPLLTINKIVSNHVKLYQLSASNHIVHVLSYTYLVYTNKTK